VDLLRGTVSVAVTRTTISSGTIEKAPKTNAGRRTLAVPPNVLSVLEDHLKTFVGAEPDAPVLVGEKGAAVSPAVLQTAWHKARLAIGGPDLHLHDLRHSGLTADEAAVAGSTPEGSPTPSAH
jgi:integrase